jgi:Holliday junction resolvasome RuvABC ATP-dependent DNA helicase subunit
MAQLQIPEIARVPQAYHFALLGNPATGKTTVGKLLGKMLHELGIRQSAVFIETSGEEPLRMGRDHASKLISSAMDGVLFIDEAYTLEPDKNSEGAAVVLQLLKEAETQRDKLTIVIAGYNTDIETKLNDFNDGFYRRFPFQLHFEDYNDIELGRIFEQLCRKYQWTVSTADVIKLASRKVGRRRGHKSFGNASSVREIFEESYRRALKRAQHQMTIIAEDIIGIPPNLETNPLLKAALDELEKYAGLDSVKEKIYQLVQMTQVNYQRQLSGEDPILVPLNRVFLGNPGTGKTTIVKLYGRILKALGLLSDGQSEVKQPKDLMGYYAGETQKKTSALLDRCKGKVLIIDEAYGLHGNHHGQEAVDTMVGMIHNTPGEDIAMVLIGYEKEMRKMFREMNSGLTRRFSLDDPFQFEDFSDGILERIVIKELEKNGMRMSFQVRKVFMKSMNNLRLAPNFGNAGAVISRIARAKELLLIRDPKSKEVTFSDFGIDEGIGSNPYDVFIDMFKTEHIKKELQVLESVIAQCQRDGKDVTTFIKNYIFVGNAGTGKTTIARIMATILHNLGLLSRNHVVIRSGLDLQGGYVGQTKTKVNEAMEEAQGGVFFIEEAYTLGGPNASRFALEAIDQLVVLMTAPEHLHRTVVILAGYPEAIQTMLQCSNDGLASRCTGRIEFPNWDANDCITFIKQEEKKEHLGLDRVAEQRLFNGLQGLSQLSSWANARDCNTILKALYESRALRHGSDSMYSTEDVEYALGQISRGKERGRGRARISPFTGTSLSVPESLVVLNSPPMPLTPPPIPPIAPVAPRLSEESVNLVSLDQKRQSKRSHQVMQKEDSISIVGIQNKVEEREEVQNPIFHALLFACQEIGYDANHEKRKELVTLLNGVSSKGSTFPDAIVSIIAEKTELPKLKLNFILPFLVPTLLEGMKHAVTAEEKRLKDLHEIENLKEENERRRKQEEMKKQAEVQEQLRICGLCPMGFSWHKCENGWRCAGGSHLINDDILN